MSIQNQRKWFWLGFALTAVLALGFLAISRVPSGKAQDADPAGPVNNWEALEAAANPDTLSGAEVHELIRLAPDQFGSPMVIPAADFVSDGVAPNTYVFDATRGAVRGTNSQSTCLMAPAYLPNGATITSLVMTVIDNDTINRIIVALYRANKNTGGATVVASAATTNSFASSNPQDLAATTITNGVVDNLNFSYYVTTCLPAATIQLYSARVFYNP
jgi:hypothetical protein